jgi:hypothetical protein
METYFADLTQRCKDALGNKLIGLYLQGSGAQNDYRSGKSDIDVIGVVSESSSSDRVVYEMDA